MMAKLKERAQINRRDPDFSRRLEINDQIPVTTAKPEPRQDTASEPRVNNEIVEKPGHVPVPTIQEESKKPVDIVKVRDSSDATVSKPVKIEKKISERTHMPNGKSGLVKEAATIQKDMGQKARLRFGFRFPDDLIQRAEVWAEKARCPVSAILRKSFGELRPVLIETLEKGIKYTEIPHDRVSDASASFDTSIMIEKDAYERLVKEIDPEGIMGIEAPMSRWARARFIEHFGKYLDKHGY